MKLNKYIYLLLFVGTLTACYDLNKVPEGELSTAHPFSSVGEIRNYLDQFYQVYAPYGDGVKAQGFDAGGGNYIAGFDTHSDNMASSAVSTRLAGEMSLGNARKLNEYTAIRNINYLLDNLHNIGQEKESSAFKQCVGEAYYFRAWYYFQMFKNYGPLTWVSKPLAPDIKLMSLPRNARTEVADSIISDLDKAIALLNEENTNAGMRVHRDIARTFQSEVALFEGTWEKYHKAKNDPFYDAGVTDDKINSYFKKAIEAAQSVIGRGVWSIYTTGHPRDDYRALFAITDLSNNPEVLWFKKYDGDQIGNNVNRYLNQGGGGVGVTASLVDDYLTNDGKPFVGAAKLNAKRTYGNELLPTLRDARLAQTIVTPGQQLRPDDKAPYYQVPPLIGSSSYNQNMTGYSLLKYVQIDYTGSLDAEFKGATPAIQFRYADVLLNCAEAMAEYNGRQYATEIIKVLDPLRKRVGMPSVDFDREYNTAADYPFRHVDKYIQCVRRERRIEKACEGTRLTDILRWAAADELIIGQWPHGAMFIGSNLASHPAYEGKLVFDQAKGNNLYLTGKPGDAVRYIVPTNPTGYEKGWAFRADRDYLLPIQPRMLNLEGSQWKQNPNW